MQCEQLLSVDLLSVDYWIFSSGDNQNMWGKEESGTQKTRATFKWHISLALEVTQLWEKKAPAFLSLIDDT